MSRSAVWLVVRQALVASVLALVVAGCGNGSGQPGGTVGRQGEAALTQQRQEAQRLASNLIPAVATGLGGRLENQSVTYDGCETSGLESYRSHRIDYAARITVPTRTARPYLDVAMSRMAELGLVAETDDVPGGTRVSATRGDVTATFTEREVAGPILIVYLTGTCVDTDPDDTAYWRAKSDRDGLVSTEE